MASEQDFLKAAEDVKLLNNTPGDKDLLELYGLYKQTTIGDCNTEKPGFLDFKGQSKWAAWNSRKGMSTEDARKAYIEKVNSLISACGLKS